MATSLTCHGTGENKVYILTCLTCINSALDKLLGQLGIYATRLSSISTLDKQHICVNRQLKSSKKAIKMKCVRTEKQF